MTAWPIGVIPALAATLCLAAPESCGREVPCEIAGGSYHLALPEAWDGADPLPAIMFFHGHRSSGASAMRGAVERVFGDAGYAVIAPNGQRFPGETFRYWPARAGAGARDDVAFADDVVADVMSRVPLRRDRLLVGGFSAGGSMAWMIACARGGAYAGYVAVAGALRRPVPDGPCPGGPARLLHIHGFADAQVPLEGRTIRDWHQGDVFEALDVLRQTNACRSNPAAIAADDVFSCRTWKDCGTRADMRFCLHSGGHGLPKGWAEMALDWFEQASR